MLYSGYCFEYDGITSEDYNLVIVTIGSSGADVTTFIPSYDFNEVRVSSRLEPYFYGVNYSENLSFELKVMRTNDMPLSAQEKKDISRWMFGRKKYTQFKIKADGMEDIQFKAIIDNVKNITVGNEQYGYEFTVRCNSPFAYTLPITNDFLVSEPSSTIIFPNLSDEDDYFMPYLEFVPIDGTTELSITNLSDNGRTFTMTNLVQGETIYIDNKNKIIWTSRNANILQNFNLKWLRLLRGDNSLVISSPCNLKFVNEFPQKIGT